MKLTDNEMWKAVTSCDAALDEQFFYAVKTTGIYCRPSCKSRAPLRENVLYFETGEDACHAGFRPCKRCRPRGLILQQVPLRKLHPHGFLGVNHLANAHISHQRS